MRLCRAKTRSTFEINKMQRGCVTCYMGPAGAVMGQTRFSVGTDAMAVFYWIVGTIEHAPMAMRAITERILTENFAIASIVGCL